MRRSLLTAQPIAAPIVPVIGGWPGGSGATLNAGQYYIHPAGNDVWDLVGDGVTLTRVDLGLSLSNAYLVLFLDDFSIYDYRQVTSATLSVPWTKAIPPSSFIGVWVQNTSTLGGGGGGYFSETSGLPNPPTLGVGGIPDAFVWVGDLDTCDILGMGYL